MVLLQESHISSHFIVTADMQPAIYGYVSSKNSCGNLRETRTSWHEHYLLQFQDYLLSFCVSLKTDILYYTEHTLSNYWFYDPVM